MREKGINIPIAIISAVIFTVFYIIFLYPIAAKNLNGDVSLPDTLQLNSENLIKGHFYKSFETYEENKTTILDIENLSDKIQFEYKIKTNHKRISGKLINLSENIDEDSIVQVKILGDGETIIYKNEWDLKKSNEIVIDESFEKIRTLRFEISYYSYYRTKFAMSDFIVSAEGE